MPPMLGLDIGGANLKASDGETRSVSVPFALWREPDNLADALRALIDTFPSPAALAVTMTGELADCFATKADGVRHILSAVEDAANGAPVAVWTTGGEFVSADDARELTVLVAAANWHALATWGARSIPDGSGLLIDIGSTTTDVIPFAGGVPVPDGRTDLERLQSRELIYTGVRRTPISAVVSDVPFRDGRCSVAAELFATTLDAYLLLGDIPEDESDSHTANGRPATISCARARLARMVCADEPELNTDELIGIARCVAAAQQSRLATAVAAVLARQPKRCELVLLSGAGSFLAERIVPDVPALEGIRRLSLAATFGPQHSDAACAYALARLARERRIG